MCTPPRPTRNNKPPTPADALATFIAFGTQKARPLLPSPRTDTDPNPARAQSVLRAWMFWGSTPPEDLPHGLQPGVYPPLD